MTALIGGEVSVHFSNPQTSGAFIKAGRVRGLAVTSRARLKAFPDIPTMAEAGVPGCEGGPFWGRAREDATGRHRETQQRVQSHPRHERTAQALRQ